MVELCLLQGCLVALALQEQAPKVSPSTPVSLFYVEGQGPLHLEISWQRLFKLLLPLLDDEVNKLLLPLLGHAINFFLFFISAL